MRLIRVLYWSLVMAGYHTVPFVVFCRHVAESLVVPQIPVLGCKLTGFIKHLYSCLIPPEQVQCAPYLYCNR